MLHLNSQALKHGLFHVCCFQKEEGVLLTDQRVGESEQQYLLVCKSFA